MANASDIIAEVQYELSDPDGDEFSTDTLLLPLNNALRYISSMSRSIVHEISTAVQQGVYQYVLPDRYLGVRAGQDPVASDRESVSAVDAGGVGWE